MDIIYDYEVFQVDAESRTMLVRYTAEGFDDHVVSMRIPYEGESLESVIRACSPVNYWISLTLPVVVPEVGVKGTVAPEPTLVAAPVAASEPTPITEPVAISEPTPVTEPTPPQQTA
jgi:hypothetical protein